MSKRPKSARSSRSKSKKTGFLKKSSAQALFFLNAILWFLYAVYIIVDMSTVNNSGISMTAVGFFLVVVIGSLLAAGILIMRYQRWVYYFALGVTALNILLALTSLADYFYILALIMDLLIVLTLYNLRKSYSENL